jgi:subtilisin-like proprotein convertase family protein
MKNILALAIVAVASSSFAVTFGPSTVGSIPDNDVTGISSTIAIGTGIASVQSITLRGVSHTWVGDLVVTVTAPNGAVVDLFRKIQSGTATGTGDSSNFLNADLTFEVGGANLWTAAAGGTSAFNIPGGTYEPSTNLLTTVIATSYAASSFASFDNQAAGNWTLTAVDNAGADIGSIASWEINATPVPEPATMTALALGLAAVARRRKNA